MTRSRPCDRRAPRSILIEVHLNAQPTLPARCQEWKTTFLKQRSEHLQEKRGAILQESLCHPVVHERSYLRNVLPMNPS